ncbi:MAG: hypothetical protein US36_C0008G0033 [Candidatus Wolfebacteria bacterium GW2011_GWC1_37_10]|uniref:Uncharacterized protein n=1 Tax=Candidatus Wolfebacteria bacterium GW2011_GWC1_37_10 TaxID=1619010 RepID=A0A0G0J2E1_9BACT|nr:MAG: hypothetical protein US36_C0008G0033 [Candidatus Wolfebacteria bacterium GW2011_GWC1_37_10]
MPLRDLLIGRQTDSESVNLGSSPSPAAYNKKLLIKEEFFVININQTG